MLAIELSRTVTLAIGGSRGIGAAICRLVAQAGGEVAWTHTGSEAGQQASDRLESEVRALGRRALSCAVDAVDEAATEAFVAEVVAQMGRLDHLVYNAGQTSPVSFADLTVAEWRANVDLNLNGAFIATHAALPHLQAAGGAIVLIGSAAVLTGGGGRADYVSAKAGLEGLSRAITKEFAPAGIRCNVVHPSLVETDLLRTRYPDPADRERVAAQVPLRRLGQPEDVAALTVFLLSDLASYLTGQAILVDGGRTLCR
jgi:NAD(P)-dependent dehydrogenase (short-subunit alcohol dehydrogenase family)